MTEQLGYLSGFEDETGNITYKSPMNWVCSDWTIVFSYRGHHIEGLVLLGAQRRRLVLPDDLPKHDGRIEAAAAHSGTSSQRKWSLEPVEQVPKQPGTAHFLSILMLQRSMKERTFKSRLTEVYDESPIKKRKASGTATASRVFERTSLETSAWTIGTWKRSAR